MNLILNFLLNYFQVHFSMSKSVLLRSKCSLFRDIVPRYVNSTQSAGAPLVGAYKRSKQHNRTLLYAQSSFKQFSTSTVDCQNDSLISISYKEIGSVHGAMKTVTMMSPKTRNSLSLEMIEDIISELNDDGSSVENEKVRCIVIKGEGKAFSAGHNLKEMTMNEGRDYHAKIFERCNVLMNKIISCPVPVIAVVDGVAAAAGCQLVAMCDIAIATESSR